MQIRQTALRAAAAATVAVFMTVGAMGPVHADEEQSGETATSTATAEQESAEQTDQGEDEASTGDSEQPEPRSAEQGDAGDETGAEKDNAGKTCDQLGYTKFDEPRGSEELEFGTLEWGADTLTYDIAEGFTVDLCIKSGVQAPITTFVVTGPEAGSKQIAQDISHIGYIQTSDEAEENETCPEGTSVNDAGECVAPVQEGETCPEGTSMNDAGECVAPVQEGETCPEGTSMNDAGECVAPAQGADEQVDVEPVVLGTEAERDDESAVEAEAEVAPASGILPATGAGDYALLVAAGLGLLAMGGALLVRRRLRTES